MSARGPTAGAVKVADTGSSWTCATCGVNARIMPGFEAPLIPVGWSNNPPVCLGCRRSAVKVSAEHRGLSKPEVARELARFEIMRTPTAGPSEIAKRGLSPKPNRTVIQEVRAELVRAGRLSPLRTRRAAA